MQGNGSRIDNRARGNATQLFEKYKNLAADAQRASDRVNTEYYLQFADHYFRVLSEQRGRFEDQPQQPRRPRDEFDYEGDDEFGEEGDPIRAGEQGEAPRTDRDAPRSDRDGPRPDRDSRPADRDERPREARGNRENGDARADNNRPEGGRREWRDRDDRGPQRNGPVRNDVVRNDVVRNDVRTDSRPGEPEQVAGQRRAEPIAAGESLEQRAEDVIAADRPLDPPGRRRGRPPRDVARDDAGDVAEPSGFEADRLPPALTVPANDEGEALPRRRRARRPVDDTPTAAE